MLVMWQAARRRCVLVADDHPPLRQGVRLVLEDAGYRVVEAGSAAEAVACAELDRPDVCLLDLSMPGGGLVAMEQIHAAGGRAAIIVLTGDEDDASVSAALEAGACGYLVKGKDDGLLLDAIEIATRGLSALPRRYLRLLGSGRNLSVSVGGQRINLTARESEILRQLERGASTAEIARRAGLAPATVRRHISGALHKLGVSTRAEAVALFAADRGDAA